MYKNYISTADFTKSVGVSVEAFFNVENGSIYQTSRRSNELQFLKNTHINPGLGIILHKPLKSFTKNHVKLFFIYHKDDGDLIKNTFYEYITNGWHMAASLIVLIRLKE